ATTSEGQVWVFSLVAGAPAWTQLAPSNASISYREGQAGTYDSTLRRLLFFGGAPDAYSEYSDVASLTLPATAAPVWRDHIRFITPTWITARSESAIAYDPSATKLVVFGGRLSGLRLQDVWTVG